MQRLLLLVLAGTMAACDFSPTLDVPLPEFEPALTITGVLAADSTVEIRVTETLDPYAPDGGLGGFEAPEGTTVGLWRDGASAGSLRLDPNLCRFAESYDPGTPPEARCGVFVSDTVVEPGRTYTVRASAPGFPSAEATVTVPARVPITLVAGEPTSTPVPTGTRVDRDLTVTFRDPPGLGDRYALLVMGEPFSEDQVESRCVDEACTATRDTTVTYTYQFQLGYTTSDPVLIAGARVPPSSGPSFVTFTDETFDGTTRPFDVRVRSFGSPDREASAPEAVWLVAVDAETFGAYQIAWFGYPAGDELNPFQEPLNLPSNVEGGYGLLGAVTINAALVE